MPSARKGAVLVTAIAAATSLALTTAPAANAHGSHGKPSWSRTLTTDVLLPFQMSIHKGKVYVADGGLGVVARVDGSSLTTLATPPAEGWDIAGVDVARDGTLAYTTAFAPPDSFSHTGAKLIIKKHGRADVVADIYEYESTHNPDSKNRYGLPPGDDCAPGRAILEQATGVPASYTGVVDPHPYSVASLGNGNWAVADAGANAIFKVDARGRVSTLAVLPPQPLKLTQELFDALGLPPEASCLVGMTYNFEPVPTDVEVGPFGQLWVTTLPGGPEDGSLGARGSLYVVNPHFGASFKIASGFFSSTNVAVTSDGTAYVAELGGNKITKVTWWGKKSTFKELTSPLAVEVDGPWLYAATSGIDFEAGAPNGNGAILKFRR